MLGVVEVNGDPDLVRAALRELPRTRGGSLHFSKESPSRRIQLAKIVSDMPVTFTVVVSRTQERLRRARGVCVRNLALHFHARLTVVVFEARQDAENAHDASVLVGLRSQGLVLPYEFAGKDGEPLLWISDLLAGAVRQFLIDGDASVLDVLGAIDRVDAR